MYKRQAVDLLARHVEVRTLIGHEAVELAEAADTAALRAELLANYRGLFANPYKAAELGFIDQVIAPEETRRHVARSFALLRNKRQENPRKKHGNIPL